MEYDKLQLIEHKAEKLLQDAKSNSENSVYTNALYIMIALFLVSLCYIYIKSGSHTLVYAAALVIALIAYKFMISNAANELENKTDYKAFATAEKQIYVKNMLQYLAANINLQLSRIKALRTVYMLVFPFFLMMIRQIVLGPIEDDQYIINLFGALLIGVCFWFFFFKKDIDDKEQDYWEVVNLSKTIQS